MTTVRCRVDDRLLHAEVLYGELGAERPDRLVIASRLEWLSMIDVGQVPPDVPVAVTAPDTLSEHLGSGRSLVVVGTVPELAEAVAAGLAPDVVALANGARHPGSWPLSRTFWCDEDASQRLLALLDAGVAIGLQRVPNEPFVPLSREALAPPGGADEIVQNPHDASP